VDLTRRGRFPIAGLWCCLTVAGPAGATESPRFDGRDRYTLFDRHLQTRQLRQQLEQPDQDFRLTRGWHPFLFAGDVSIGTQQTYGYGSQTHFHGFAIADTFLSLELLPGLDITLNLLAFNPSASDGYRASAAIKPGVAVDAGTELFDIAGEPLRFGVTGTDLGVITLGQGLLFEQMELEGVAGFLEYESARLSYLYGGRALWADDDLIRSELSLLDGRLRFAFIEWQTKFQLRLPSRGVGFDNIIDEKGVSRYADVSVDLPLGHGFRAAAEYALRFRERPRSAALLRADFSRRDLGRLELHLGYQFRFYEHGVGPRTFSLLPTVPLSFPYQEDTYVTNPFEYLGIAEDFEQWSHTLMLETRFELRRGLEIFGYAELWQRTASAFSRAPAPIATAEGFAAPGQRLSAYYSAGFSYYPWQHFPHRADVYVTNKQVPGEDEQPTFQRFKPGRYYVLRLKAFF
jgi:hypothetical protein